MTSIMILVAFRFLNFGAFELLPDGVASLCFGILSVHLVNMQGEFN